MAHRFDVGLTVINKPMNRNIVFDFDSKHHLAPWYAPPFFPLTQGGWITLNQHRRDIFAAAYRNIGRTTLEVDRRIG